MGVALDTESGKKVKALDMQSLILHYAGRQHGVQATRYERNSPAGSRYMSNGFHKSGL